MTAEANRLFVATALAREVMARTEVEGLPLFGHDSGDFGEEFPEYTWEREAVDLLSTGPDGGGFSTVFSDLKQVRVRVSWKQGERARSTELFFFAVDETGMHHRDAQ